MADFSVKFTGKIDRRSPQNEGEPDSPILRENWLCREGRLKKPQGTEEAISGLSDIPRWIARYYSLEAGVVSPKTFVYTKNGKIWVLDDSAGTATVARNVCAVDAFPRHWLYKTTEQIKLYFVDGENLFSHDGNADNIFDLVTLTDTGGDTIKPIDVIEHRDRLILISKTMLFISKNLDPEIFDNATDSLAIIVGSGQGENLALGKIEDKLYIFNTEGIFVLEGDVISALAATFEIRLVDEKRLIAAHSACKAERAIIFVADDLELWAWNGSSSQMLSYDLKFKDFLNPSRNMLDKMSSVYYDNYYMLSFVETGDAEPNTELWWDAFENKIDIVKGRNVSCYMGTNPSRESEYLQLGRSDEGSIMNAGRGYNFDGVAIASRLRTRDLTPKKGYNVRFEAFYPEIEPTGNRNITISYLLDGRSSNPSGANAHWDQNLRGETKTLGLIHIGNQAQFMGRVRPKINYSRGESIAFEIVENTLDLRADLLGISIDYIAKERSKGKTIGA